MDFYINFEFPILRPRHFQWEVLLITATGHYILHTYSSHCSFDKKRTKSNLHIPTKEMGKTPVLGKKKGGYQSEPKRLILHENPDAKIAKSRNVHCLGGLGGFLWLFSVIVLHRVLNVGLG